MAHWDVFHADRLELERGLDKAAIRHALECGDLRDDDLVRPAGTTVTWSRLAEVPELTEAASPSPDLTKSAPVSADPEPHEPAVACPESSDFEVESADFGPELSDSPATLRSPDWVELRNDPDDVAFPVINDAPPGPTSNARTPKNYEPVPPGGWLWAEEVEPDDEDSDEAIGDEDDETPAAGLEILDDDSAIAPPGSAADLRG